MAFSPDQASNETSDAINNTADMSAMENAEDGPGHQDSPSGGERQLTRRDFGDENSIKNLDEAGELNLEDVERRNVRLEVQGLIAPWQESERRPPFTAAELIVIACLCAEQKVDRAGILSMILHTFSYYRTKAIDQYVSGQILRNSMDEYLYQEPAIVGFDQAFNLWDVPLVDASAEELVCWKDDGEDEVEITVPPRAGRIYLRNRLHPQARARTAFRFLDLPPEIRNVIYEMVFTMPGQAVTIDSRPFQVTPCLLVSCRFEDRYAHDCAQEGSDYLDDYLEIPKREVFALLLVNKQIYQEARSIFYSLNSLTCLQTGDLRALVEGVPATRLRHVKRLDISLRMAGTEFGGFEARMKRLCVIRSLSTLKVRTEDEQWLKMPKYMREKAGRKTQYTNFRQIPGLHELAVVCSRAEKLTISGVACEQFKVWIEEEVEKIRKHGEEKVKTKRSGSKRKAMIGVEDVEEDGPSKAKAKRA